tara:strand:- start:4346 stop:4816 length:471 start_codon:yes stop_codon:yes gene_type:complete
METVENVLLGEGIPDLRLELDFENIPTKDYCEIVTLFKSCPSLVNDDIVSVTEEIISRIDSMIFTLDNDTYKLINNLHFMLHKIPNTTYLIDRLIMNCPWISKSPAVDPVSSPKIMKKMKIKPQTVVSVDKVPKIMKKVKSSSGPPLKSKSYLCPC